MGAAAKGENSRTSQGSVTEHARGTPAQWMSSPHVKHRAVPEWARANVSIPSSTHVTPLDQSFKPEASISTGPARSGRDIILKMECGNGII